MAYSILVIEDDLDMQRMIGETLGGEGYKVVLAKSGEEGVELVKKSSPELALIDIKLPGMDGIEVLKKIKEMNSNIQVIMITAYGSVELALKSVRNGAHDFIEKPFELDSLVMRVEKALESLEYKDKIIQVYEEKGKEGSEEKIIYKSGKMKAVLSLVKKSQGVSSPILVTGESGVGKELVARSIHFGGARKDKPFLPLNCGAIPQELLESELFGHLRGSFTGAVRTKHGLFEAADGGTIFLDEIGDAPLVTQKKLLRVLDRGEFFKIGAVKPTKVDVRTITATNKDLLAEVKKGEFREDLYYRVSVIPIHLPPLRERKEDILPLVNHFLKICNQRQGKKVSLSEEVERLLPLYSFPGNVRELHHLMEHLVLFSEDNLILPEHLPEAVRKGGLSKEEVNLNLPYQEVKKNLLGSFEKDYFKRLYEENEGNISRCAREAKMDRKDLRAKLKKYGVVSP